MSDIAQRLLMFTDDDVRNMRVEAALEIDRLRKVLAMFTPYPGRRFLDHDGAETICGPNDRAMIGMDTNFPKAWLVEDYGFTEKEADWFIAQVKAAHATTSDKAS